MSFAGAPNPERTRQEVNSCNSGKKTNIYGHTYMHVHTHIMCVYARKIYTWECVCMCSFHRSHTYYVLIVGVWIPMSHYCIRMGFPFHKILTIVASLRIAKLEISMNLCLSRVAFSLILSMIHFCAVCYCSLSICACKYLEIISFLM